MAHNGFRVRVSARQRALLLLAAGATLATGVLTCPTAQPARAAMPPVEVVRTPNGGYQPQAAVDARSNLHVVYLKGNPKEADIFYVHRDAGKDAWSSPIRVNSEAGTAVAVGTIRGAQLALGKSGRVHVVWFGSSAASQKAAGGGAPLLYARLQDGGTAFESQRNLMQSTTGLDGGASVAADAAGNVYAFWHAQPGGSSSGEANRKAWVARSKDEGKTFARESPAITELTGACACCSTKAFADSRGTLFGLFRSATGGVDRDTFLLTSRTQGQSFSAVRVDPWRLNSCPMSSYSLAETSAGILAAWETRGQVLWAHIEPATSTVSTAIAAPGSPQGRKHPSVAGNARGETLLAWTEGTGWERGGALAWQVFDKDNRPTAEKGRLEGGIPVWGLAPVVSRPDGGFTILH